jgi:hypothetical protein
MDREGSKSGALQMGIILLAVATALIHITLGLQADLTTKIMFSLNGLGYLALTAALYLPRFQGMRRGVRWLLMAFTLVTILAWVAIGRRALIAYIDKAIEVALIALLWAEARQRR